MEQFWNGFKIEKGIFEGKNTVVVFPKEEMRNGFLAVKTEYWDAFPEAVEIDLLKSGYHLCFIDNDNRWGTDKDIDRKARFISAVAEKYSLSRKAVFVGMSCGGLFAIKTAAEYPELASCLYLDAPVLNYMSCPCGFGDAQPLDEGRGIPEILNALDMESVSELIGYRDMPLDKIPKLIENEIPIVMVAGDSDKTVPYHENGMLLENAYRKSNIHFEVYIKQGADHHPHGLTDNTPVISFINKENDYE